MNLNIYGTVYHIHSKEWIVIAATFVVLSVITRIYYKSYRWRRFCRANGLYEQDKIHTKNVTYPKMTSLSWLGYVKVKTLESIPEQRYIELKQQLGMFLKKDPKSIIAINGNKMSVYLYFKFPDKPHWKWSWKVARNWYFKRKKLVYVGRSSSGPVTLSLEDNVLNILATDPGRGKSSMLRVLVKQAKEIYGKPKVVVWAGEESPDFDDLGIEVIEGAENLRNILVEMKQEIIRRYQVIRKEGLTHYLDHDPGALFFLIIDEAQHILGDSKGNPDKHFKEIQAEIKNIITEVAQKYRKAGVCIWVAGTEARSGSLDLPFTSAAIRIAAGLGNETQSETFMGEGIKEAAFSKIPKRKGLVCYLDPTDLPAKIIQLSNLEPGRNRKKKKKVEQKGTAGVSIKEVETIS